MRHILIEPTEVLNERAAEELAGNLIERVRGVKTLARWLDSTRTTLEQLLRVENWADKPGANGS